MALHDREDDAGLDPHAESGATVRNLVAGEWREPAGDRHPVTDPGTGEQVGTVGYSTSADVDDAVAAAREAFADWSRRPVEERIQPLFRYKALLEDHQDDLAHTLATEHGKTLSEAKGELRRGIENVEVACGMPSLLKEGSGIVEQAAPEIDESGVRRPLGVFAAITPFNFPGMIPLWFMPHAVATGNTFLLKPSERDPITPARLVELAHEAGIPEGVVNLVNGGPESVNAICDHEDVAGVSFVGSTGVAKHVYERAASAGKRVQAQGGAKNHVIVSDSADLAFAAEQTVSSACACAGERCLANDVVLTMGEVYDEFAEQVVAEAAAATVGYGPDDPDVGALITSEHRDEVAGYVARAVEAGAELLHDGRDVTVDGHEDGTYMDPTVVGGVTPDMEIAREEIFGPVVALSRVDSFDEAIGTLNASDYGNAASLFTERGHEAQQFRREARAGNLAVNAGTAAPMAFYHFGGEKASFFGDLHAQADDAVRFYTDQTVYIERWPGE
ncbi:methylmalonate-semialdehyde dehydrogenase (CoA acylating) [Halobacteriales archaeon QS_4_70_19]|nr:MAG: methylmalonate-semialdehyde dehydrogenase (CoA acylating) [Halobacteriales archaeon QS_4_70_19]